MFVPGAQAGRRLGGLSLQSAPLTGVASRLASLYLHGMTFWVKQHQGAIPVQVGADSPEDAILAGDAWKKDGPVKVECPNGRLYSLEEFRERAAKGEDFGRARGA